MKYKSWHNWLAMEHQSAEWYERDLADEFEELQESTKFIDRWSEYADVVYTVSRSRWDNHAQPSPISGIKFLYGSVYMFPKYTLRWLFFRKAGKKAGAQQKISTVTNPKKEHKLVKIAEQYNVDPVAFVKICQKQLKYWPLPK